MASHPPLADPLAALAGLGFRPAVSTDVEAEAHPVGDGRFKVTCTRPSMGTLVSITAIHTSKDLIQDAAGKAFQEMDRVVELLNRYDSNSAVGYLNSEGRLQGSPPELDLVLGRALVLGVLGGALGCLIGFVIARALSVEFPSLLMVCTLVGAPLVAILASYLPTRSAVRQDPAVLLQDQ